MIVAIVMIVDAGEKLTHVVVLLTCLGMIFQVYDVFSYWFQSRLESKVAATATLVGYIITSAYRIILLATNKSIEYFAFATSIDHICVAALLLWQYRRHSNERLRFSWAYAKELLQRSCHFILPGIMVSLYSQTDKLMLKQMLTQAEVGYYATALAICNMWVFILSAIIDSAYPPIMEANKTDEALFKLRNKQLYAIIFFVSLIGAIGICTLSKPIVQILYGEQFLPAVAPLRVITWYTAFSYLGVARNAWIVAKNKQKYLLFVYISAAVSNIILNACLIPLWGAVGAAMASLIAQIITILIAPFFIKEVKENAVLMFEAIVLKGLVWGK